MLDRLLDHAVMFNLVLFRPEDNDDFRDEMTDRSSGVNSLTFFCFGGCVMFDISGGCVTLFDCVF